MTTGEKTAYNNGFIIGMASKGVVTIKSGEDASIINVMAENISLGNPFIDSLDIVTPLIVTVAQTQTYSDYILT